MRESESHTPSTIAGDLGLAGPLMLRRADPPHWRGAVRCGSPMVWQAVGTAVVCAAGLVLFGWRAAGVLLLCAGTALAIAAAADGLARLRRPWSRRHAVVLGLLTGCTLPPDAAWSIALTATAIAVLLGLYLQGGLGSYLWHPVALARVAVQLIFHSRMSPERWPVLAPDRLVLGDVTAATPLPPLGAWSQPPPPGYDAWLVQRPIDLLRDTVPCGAGSSPAEALAELLRDRLPDWADTLWGGAGGGIGETCLLALLGVGLLLAWRGVLRWGMAGAALLAAAVLAVVLPIQLVDPAGQASRCWLPGLLTAEGLPIGVVYVLYQLSAVGLPFVIVLLASDLTSSPLTRTGHVLFGLIAGGTTLLLRVLWGLPADAYWALLLANTLVPLIDRLTRRRVMGTSPSTHPVWHA